MSRQNRQNRTATVATVEAAPVAAEPTAPAVVQVEAPPAEPVVTVEPAASPAAPVIDHGANAAAALNAGIKAFKKGERAACEGRIVAGLSFTTVVREMIADGKKRALATQIIQSRLFIDCKETMGVSEINQLMRSANAFDLIRAKLPEGKVTYDSLSYGHWLHAKSLLVETLDNNTEKERCVLLPGLESKCVSLYETAVLQSMNREDMKTASLSLVAEYNAALAAEAKRVNEEKEAVRKASEAETLRLRAEQEKAASELRVKLEAEKAALAEAERVKTEEARTAARLAEENRKQAELLHQQTIDKAILSASQSATDASEAKQASKRLAEAEAAKTRANERDAERKKREADKAAGITRGDRSKEREQAASEVKMPAPSSWKDKPVRDVADMLAGIVHVHSQSAALATRMVDLFAHLPILPEAFRNALKVALVSAAGAADAGPTK